MRCPAVCHEQRPCHPTKMQQNQLLGFFTTATGRKMCKVHRQAVEISVPRMNGPAIRLTLACRRHPPGRDRPSSQALNSGCLPFGALRPQADESHLSSGLHAVGFSQPEWLAEHRGPRRLMRRSPFLACLSHATGRISSQAVRAAHNDAPAEDHNGARSRQHRLIADGLPRHRPPGATDRGAAAVA